MRVTPSTKTSQRGYCPNQQPAHSNNASSNDLPRVIPHWGIPPTPGVILPNASSSSSVRRRRLRLRSSGRWCHHRRHDVEGREECVVESSRRRGRSSRRRWPRRRRLRRRRNDDEQQAIVRGRCDGEGIDLPRIFVVGGVSAADVARARERGGHRRWRISTLWYVGFGGPFALLLSMMNA